MTQLIQIRTELPPAAAADLTRQAAETRQSISRYIREVLYDASPEMLAAIAASPETADERPARETIQGTAGMVSVASFLPPELHGTVARAAAATNRSIARLVHDHLMGALGDAVDAETEAA